MQIIKVKYLKGEVPNGRDYTFYSNELVKLGDLVQINPAAKGVVTEVDVTESEIEALKDRVKTIVGKIEVSGLLWKIKSIAHSGTMGTRGLPRLDGRYINRVGRIVKGIDKYQTIGVPLILEYVKDEFGNDYSGYSLNCSLIVGIHGLADKLICIETMNTIYEFEKVGA